MGARAVLMVDHQRVRALHLHLSDRPGREFPVRAGGNVGNGFIQVVCFSGPDDHCFHIMPVTAQERQSDRLILFEVQLKKVGASFNLVLPLDRLFANLTVDRIGVSEPRGILAPTVQAGSRFRARILAQCIVALERRRGIAAVGVEIELWMEVADLPLIIFCDCRIQLWEVVCVGGDRAEGQD